MCVDRLNLIFLYFYNINERLDEMNCFQSAVFFFADFLIVDNILNISDIFELRLLYIRFGALGWFIWDIFGWNDD